MKKKFLIIYIITIPLSFNCFSETGCGYWFRFNKFKLSIDFNEYALYDFPNENKRYIEPQYLFFNLLQLLYSNKNYLEANNIIINISQSNYKPIDTIEKFYVQLLKDNTDIQYTYTIDKALTIEENIFLILNTILDLKNESGQIPIKVYEISVPSNICGDDDWMFKWKQGNIFLGTFLSYSYKPEKDEYTCYFFSKKESEEFLSHNKINKQYMSEVNITTQMVSKIFRKL